MQVSSIQGQTLATPISVEAGLLELLEIAATATTEVSDAVITTDYSNATLTSSVSLPIQQRAQPDGTVIIYAIDGSIPGQIFQ